MSEYKISENLAVSESGFLFMANTGESFTVNETGKEIIELLKDEKSKEEIIAALMEKFEVDAETAERDFEEFISTLKDLKLVTKS
jgi:PqqD family protein of HPr-rel-A system